LGRKGVFFAIQHELLAIEQSILLQDVIVTFFLVIFVHSSPFSVAHSFQAIRQAIAKESFPQHSSFRRALVLCSRNTLQNDQPDPVPSQSQVKGGKEKDEKRNRPSTPCPTFPKDTSE
jgi:hypothetical protein